MKGIDVSSYTGAVDWEQARSAIGFAIVRAGYGQTAVDPWFERHLAGAKAAGLRVGAYYYSYALDPEEARAEARHLLRIADGRAFDMPLWCDMEDADGYKAKHGFVFSRENISAVTQAFVDEVRTGGYPCGVYASESWLEDYIRVQADGIWVAQWAPALTYAGKADIWQNSDSGCVPGVAGPVDTDVLYTKFWEEDEMKVYHSVPEMPAWAQGTFARLVQAGYVAKNAAGEIEVQESSLQPMVYMDRLTDGKLEKLPELIAVLEKEQ